MGNKVLDLFAGCGGLSYGFQLAGYDIIGFIEWWQPAIATFLQNHPSSTHIGMDITKISDEILLKYNGKVDIIVGGPPCQGFSICGKRNPKDERNKLYQHFLRCVRLVEPHTVVMENVRGLLSMKAEDNEFVISKIMRDFVSLGYFVSYKVLTASDFGVAQNRQRLFIIAQKLNLFPLPTTQRKTVHEALNDLPNKENGLNGHIFFPTQAETLLRIKKLKQGELLCQKFKCGRLRLFADKPSRTITTNPNCIHPHHDRFLTPREYARLQSFPDSFEFAGSRNDMVKQIGNAVPPLLAQAVAEKLREVKL